MPSQLTQDSLIQALVLLRKTFPELPAIAWEISPFPSVAGLFGKAHHDNAVDVLLSYSEVLGGEIEPRISFDVDGAHRQLLRLVTSFADVRIEIHGSVSAPELTGLHLVAAA